MPTRRSPQASDASPTDTGRPGPAWWRFLRPYALAFVVWNVFGILLLQQAKLRLALAGAPTSGWAVVAPTFAAMWLWALFTPWILAVGRRFPVGGDAGWRHLPAQLVFALFFSLLDPIVMHPLRPFLGQEPRPWMMTFAQSLFPNEMCYAVIVAFGTAARLARANQERRTEAATLRAQLHEARLASLAAQLRPHFLFNTLNAAAELVHRDPDGADRTITSLGVLLRRSLSAAERPEVSFQEELELIDEYLAIVGVRLGDRLTVSREIEPEAREALVPVFILQPLVENAVAHGIERAPAGGTIQLVARRAGARLVVEIRDDGPGLAPGGRDGVGLRVTRERLHQHYGDAARISLTPRVPHGTVAELELPYRLSARDLEAPWVGDAAPPVRHA